MDLEDGGRWVECAYRGDGGRWTGGRRMGGRRMVDGRREDGRTAGKAARSDWPGFSVVDGDQNKWPALIKISAPIGRYRRPSDGREKGRMPTL